MKKTIMFMYAISLLASCGKSYNVNLAVDNPTDDYITVQIDSLVIEVPPREVVWVEMGAGERTFKLDNDSVIKQKFGKGMYMLNPTFHEYLLIEEIYGNGFSSMPNKTITYYGTEFEGQFDVVKSFVAPVTWDYGPREALPEMMEIEGSYELVKKLLDLQEFIDLMAMYENTDKY